MKALMEYGNQVLFLPGYLGVSKNPQGQLPPKWDGPYLVIVREEGKWLDTTQHK